MSKFKFEKTNKYSKLRNDMIEFALDGLQTKNVIQNIHNEVDCFTVGTFLFVCEDIFQTENVYGDYIDEISEGYRVFDISFKGRQTFILNKEQR